MPFDRLRRIPGWLLLLSICLLQCGCGAERGADSPATAEAEESLAGAAAELDGMAAEPDLSGTPEVPEMLTEPDSAPTEMPQAAPDITNVAESEMPPLPRSPPLPKRAGAAPPSAEPPVIDTELPETVVMEPAPAEPTPRAAADGAASAGSAAADSAQPLVIRRPGESVERRGYSSEKVYFATNRLPDEDAQGDPDLYFGAQAGPLIYGACEVSMPYRRVPGSLPEPSILRLEFHQDPARHVVLMQLELLPQSAFWQQLRAEVARSPERQLMVFIHGYSASFRDAARRTAQLAYDLNYQGPAMFFSWPAGSASEGLNRWNYLNDLRRADESREDLISVLEILAATVEARQIHLVAHSMGNHLLTESLKIMTDRRGGPEAVSPLFKAVAMAAPDLNAREFVDRTARRIRGFSERFTVYASRHDKALRFSQSVNGWDPLGSINASSVRLTQVERFELVDASAVSEGWFDSGHVYYGDMPEVISDVRCIFQGLSLARRGLLATPPTFRLVRHGR